MGPRLSLHTDFDAAKEAAKAVISSGGTVIYPTDTLYGLGCDATSASAVEKIHSIKSRDALKPLSILVSDYPMLLEYCEVSSAQERILHSLLPGPYTFILALRKALPASKTMEIGIRVPEHYFMRQVSRELSLPIVATSANLSGEKGAARLQDVGKAISLKADLLVDGGACKYGIGSTVIDLLRMKILRKGAVRDGDKFEFG